MVDGSWESGYHHPWIPHEQIAAASGKLAIVTNQRSSSFQPAGNTIGHQSEVQYYAHIYWLRHGLPASPGAVFIGSLMLGVKA